MGANIEIRKGPKFGKEVIIDGIKQNSVVSVSTKVVADKVDTVLIEYAVDSLIMLLNKSQATRKILTKTQY